MSNISDNTRALQEILNAVNELPGSVNDDSHIHDERYYTKGETDVFLVEKSDKNHNHDGRYYTAEETDAFLTEKSNKQHRHDGVYITNAEADLLAASKSDINHNHNSTYNTKEETAQLLLGKSDVNHTHENYALKTELPQVPAKLSQLTNDEGYVKSSELNSALSEKSDLSHNHDGLYASVSELNTVYALANECAVNIIRRTEDWIIDSGSVENWRYRRWNSGYVECSFYGEILFDAESFIASASHGMNVYSIDIPFPFNMPDGICTTCSCLSEGYEWVQSVGFDEYVTVRRFCSAEDFSQSPEMIVSVHATGYVDD